MSQAIRIVTTKHTTAWPKGAELEFASTASADDLLGKGAYRIVSNADGSPYQAPKAEKVAEQKSTKKGE